MKCVLTCKTMVITITFNEVGHIKKGRNIKHEVYCADMRSYLELYYSASEEEVDEIIECGLESNFTVINTCAECLLREQNFIKYGIVPNFEYQPRMDSILQPIIYTMWNRSNKLVTRPFLAGIDVEKVGCSDSMKCELIIHGFHSNGIPGYAAEKYVRPIQLILKKYGILCLNTTAYHDIVVCYR